MERENENEAPTLRRKMPCNGLADSDVDPARHIVLERAQGEHFIRLYDSLRKETTATIPDEQLEALDIARGERLEVDNLDAPRPGDTSLFFSPCQWSEKSLNYESHSGYIDSEWIDLTKQQPELFTALLCARFRAEWFITRLLNLETIEENVWEPAIDQPDRARFDCARQDIIQHIGLELPRYEYYWDTLGRPENEFKGTWAYFAAPFADKPHGVCLMLESTSPAEGVFSRSEVQAAVRMTEFQLQRASFTHHHTKPVLVCTYFQNETARLTQAHFDSKSGRLILRPSRILDLSGVETPSDAWLMLRWMASAPVGVTQYQPSVILSSAASKDKASRPPQISIAG